MSDYTKILDYKDKDALATSDPLKIILGAEWDAEFDAIETAVATKFEPADFASEAEAEAGTDDTKLMSPLRTAQNVEEQVDGPGMLSEIIAATLIQQIDGYQHTNSIPFDWDDVVGWSFEIPAGEWRFVEFCIHASPESYSHGTPGTGSLSFDFTQTPQVMEVNNHFDVLPNIAVEHINDPAEDFFCIGRRGANPKPPTYYTMLVQGHASLTTGVQMQMQRYDVTFSQFYVAEGSWMRIREYM